MKEHQTNLDRAIQFFLSNKSELEQLKQLTGLQEFKDTIHQILSAQKRFIIARSRGRNIQPSTFHMCFLGNPGTGKTEMSKLTAQILYRAGIVSKDTLTVAGRSSLVGDHVGETALKTKALLKKASGGVLLIDEAYALMDDRSNSYGDEAINTLVEELEKYRGNLVMILAGYPDKMAHLLDTNPGLQSRIPFTVHFPNYTTNQLCSIAEKMAEEDGYYFREDVSEKLTEILNNARKDPSFGNARYVRSLIEKAEATKSDRVDLTKLMTLSDDELFQLTPTEFQNLSSVRACAPQKKIGF